MVVCRAARNFPYDMVAETTIGALGTHAVDQLREQVISGFCVRLAATAYRSVLR
jgi:hypothetical protein